MVKFRLAAFAVTMALLAACSGEKADDSAESTTTTPTTIPEECLRDDGSSPDPNAVPPAGVTTVPVSQACLVARYKGALGQADEDALAKIPEDRRVALGQALCTYASVAAESEAKVTRTQMIQTVSESWSEKPEVVEAILGSLDLLCPDEAAVLSGLPGLAEVADVEIRLAGSGSAEVDYTAPNGSALSERVDLPWSQVLRLTAPVEVRVSAVGSDEDSKVESCTILVGGTEVSKADADGGRASCEASTAQIEEAAATAGD